MKINIHFHKANWKEGPWVIEGFKKHGIKINVTNKIEDCDISIFWGLKRYSNIIEKQKKDGNHFLVIERGYVNDRYKWASIGYDGLAGQADFCVDNMPDDRWQVHKHLMKLWDPRGYYILIIGQIEGDASLFGFGYKKWLNSTIEEYKQKDHNIIFRPHPGSQCLVNATHDFGLQKDLKNAFGVVTASSTTAVQSVLAGVPTIAVDDRSMAYDMSSHDILDFEYMPDRQQWANNLAYCQWTEQEIKNGEFWEILKYGPSGCFK